MNPHRDTDPTRRFSGRVDDYVKYRPHYPREILEYLVEEIGLSPAWRIADVGSGTGILSRLFLENGNQVYGVEPNDEMRSAGERYLLDFERFVSVAGRAEDTGLAPSCVALVSVGQAFHWFDTTAAGREFRRILESDGWVVLAWNTRRVDATPFMRDFESLLVEHAVDYQQVDHRNVDASILTQFFSRYQRNSFDNNQLFDYVGLEGRLMSSSYAPAQDHPRHAPLIAKLRDVFAAHQRDDRVRFDYETEVYVGRLPRIG